MLDDDEDMFSMYLQDREDMPNVGNSAHFQSPIPGHSVESIDINSPTYDYANAFARRRSKKRMNKSKLASHASAVPFYEVWAEKEVDGMKSTTYVDGGIYSGPAATTVDFHYTFTEDTIFYYACEPHITMDMFGKVTVGDGGVEPTTTNDADDKEDNNTPGFLGVTVILATLGAVLFARMRQEDEL